MMVFHCNLHLKHSVKTYRVDVDEVIHCRVTFEFQTDGDPEEEIEDMISRGDYTELYEIDSEEQEIRDFDIISIEEVDDL